VDEEQDKGFDFDIPVVTSRREFFEQEAAVAGPSEDIDTDIEPDEVADNLRRMREAAAERTAAMEEGAEGPPDR
jgi:hypothetical protein